MNEINSSLIAEHGLGFGSGSISRNELTEATEQKLTKLDQLLASGDVLVPVSKNADGKMLDDDGCGDGRGVNKTMVKDGESIVEKDTSLDRAKVFGGGPAMAGAALIATGESSPTSTKEILTNGISSLKLNMIDFGAHTDDHASGDKCGCGAIDNCPAIMNNAVTFENEIKDTIQALGIPVDGLDEVMGRFARVAENIAGKEYSGREVMDEIIESGKFVKELGGGHKEVAVVLNDVAGFTVDQEKVREISDGLQAFAVDVWRLQDIASRMYPDDEQKQLTAVQGMLVYTLATAATLTNGDLPVYRISSQDAVVAS